MNQTTVKGAEVHLNTNQENKKQTNKHNQDRRQSEKGTDSQTGPQSNQIQRHKQQTFTTLDNKPKKPNKQKDWSEVTGR